MRLLTSRPWSLLPAALLLALVTSATGNHVPEVEFFDGVVGAEPCLPNRTRTTLLMEFMSKVVHLRDTTPLRVLVKSWPSHRLNSAIIHILLTEVLGMSSVELRTTASHTTPTSFRMLSIGEGGSTQADLDMELWASSAWDEYQEAQASYVNAGATFDRARSGLFVRPSAVDRDLLLSRGRSYLNMEELLLPRLPTVSEALAAGWCGTPGDVNCLEMPNRACYERMGGPNECKVLRGSPSIAQ